MLENLLQALNPPRAYLEWNEGQIDDGKRTLPFFYRNFKIGSDIGCARSPTEMTSSTSHTGNTTPMDNGYTHKGTWWTGGGIFNYSLITLF